MFPIIDKRKTGINIRRIMDMRGLTVKDVQEYLELGSVQRIYHWINGISMPTIDNLYALSDLFHVPIDLLVCGNRKPLLCDNAHNESNERVYEYSERIKNGRAA